jgi:two-component system chemotaxis response regulator CheY
MTIATKRILSLGQCGPDHGSLSRLFRTRFQAEVLAVGTPAEALAELRSGAFDLVLVNRVLDWTGESGLDFIRQVKADAALASVPIMLVSNYEDAQQQAVADGALPGFGKAAMSQPETAARLRDILQPSPQEQIQDR